jgi:alpha-tubulin suppressor-like RCC1 family protein
MGMCAVLDQNEDQSINFIKEQAKINGFPSLPFEVDFKIPVIKITTGDMHAAILTAEAQVFTWGSNSCGVLGVDDEHILYQLKPDPNRPLKFIDSDKTYNIIDIASGYASMVALTDQREIFVWG